MEYKNDIDRGWAWIVAAAVYLGRIFLSASLYMSGVFYIALLEQYGDDEAKTSLIGSLNSGIMCLFGPAVSVLIDSFSCRTSMFIGGFLLSLSYVISSFVDHINVLILTLGVLGGLANSMTSIPFSVTLGYYFIKRRNTMIAASMSVIGLAMFIASPLALYLLDTYGLNGAFLLVGGINAHLCVIALLCKPSSEETKIRQSKQLKKMKDRAEKNTSYKNAVFKIAGKFSLMFNLQLFGNVSFVMFLFSTASWNFMVSVCLMHLPNYVVTQGYPTTAITIIMSTFGISNTLGRLLAALTVIKDRVDSAILHIGTLGVVGVVTLTFQFYSHFNDACFVFAGIIGFFVGVPNSLMTPISLKLVGIENLSSAHGLENFFCGIGIVLGPPVAGSLYERTNSYKYSFMISGIVVLVGCMLGGVSLVLSKKTSVTEKEFQNNIHAEDDAITQTTELVSKKHDISQ